MPCEAKGRDRVYKTNWECDGTGLVWVMKGPGGVPVVAPKARLNELMSAPWASLYDPQEFPGGDHYHAVLDPKE